MARTDRLYTVSFPVLSACKFTTGLADAATVAVTITHDYEIIELDQMAQAVTLNLTIDPTIKVGAIIKLKTSSDGTGRDITLGTGTDTTTVSGTANKTKWVELVYNGTAYQNTNVYQNN